MTFSTDIAHLPDGNHLSYMDTGPLQGTSTYTSVVMLHGTGYNGHVFEPLHEIAHRYCLRIFSVNRRAYVGSSGYSDVELEDLRTGNPVFLDRQAVLLGHFFEYIIRVHSLPPPNAERGDGGVVLVGWSMGCATVIPFISNAGLFRSEQYELLRRYVTKLIFYGKYPPYSAFGFDGPAGKGAPYPMFGKTLEEHYNYFRAFVGSYFDQPPDWDGDPTKLSVQPSTKHGATDSWTAEMWEKIYQPQSAALSEWPQVSGPMQNALRDLTDRALFDKASASSTFPDIKVLHIVCWKSNRLTLWAYQCMKLLYEERVASNRFVRSLSFSVQKDVNHFWHWESPHEFLQFLASSIRENSM